LVIVIGFNGKKYDSIEFYGTPVSVVAYKANKFNDRPKSGQTKRKI
jgi:hypothetical protein